MKFNGKVTILSKQWLQADVFQITVSRPEQMEEIRPGQFFNFITSKSGAPLLRRPISVSYFDQHIIEFTIKVIGAGTRLLSEFEVAQEIEIMGPLGNGFEILPAKYILIVGGGIGVAPVKGLYQKWTDENTQIDVILGYRETPYLEEAFKRPNQTITIVSEKDSQYRNGYVTEPFVEKINDVKYDMIYACGPEIMLKSLAKICADKNQPIQLLMEEKMACGIGACLVCTCKVKKNDFEYKHVRTCKEGPMFYGSEVIFHE